MRFKTIKTSKIVLILFQIIVSTILCWIVCGISPNTSIPSTEIAFGNAFFIILYVPFTSALSRIPLEVLNNPMAESMKSIKKSLEEIRYYSTQIKTIHDSNFEKSNKLITDTHTNMKNSINELKIGKNNLDKIKRKLPQNSNPQYKLPN